MKIVILLTLIITLFFGTITSSNEFLSVSLKDPLNDKEKALLSENTSYKDFMNEVTTKDANTERKVKNDFFVKLKQVLGEHQVRKPQKIVVKAELLIPSQNIVDLGKSLEGYLNGNYMGENVPKDCKSQEGWTSNPNENIIVAQVAGDDKNYYVLDGHHRGLIFSVLNKDCNIRVDYIGKVKQIDTALKSLMISYSLSSIAEKTDVSLIKFNLADKKLNLMDINETEFKDFVKSKYQLDQNGKEKAKKAFFELTGIKEESTLPQIIDALWIKVKEYDQKEQIKKAKAQAPDREIMPQPPSERVADKNKWSSFNYDLEGLNKPKKRTNLKQKQLTSQ